MDKTIVRLSGAALLGLAALAGPSLADAPAPTAPAAKATPAASAPAKDAAPPARVTKDPTDLKPAVAGPVVSPREMELRKKSSGSQVGTVRSRDGKLLVVAPPEQSCGEVRFTMDAKVVVIAGGSPAKIDSVAPGVEVNVFFAKAPKGKPPRVLVVNILSSEEASELRRRAM